MNLASKLAQLGGGLMMGKWTTASFFSYLEDHLATIAPGRERELTTAIRKRANEVIGEDCDYVIDAGSKGMLAMCAAVLAAYETLGPIIDDDLRTIVYLQHVFSEALGHQSSLMTAALLRSNHEDGLNTLETFLRSLSKFYGEAMVFECERAGNTFEMRVTTCFFKDFFYRRGLLDVTTVICAADASWMNAIDPALMGIRAHRASIMSIGDDCDRFRIETVDPLAENIDVLDAWKRRRAVQDRGESK